MITDRSDLIELAQLNLQAGRKAASSGAYAAAGELLDVALQAAATDGWQTHHELTMCIHRELAMAEHLVGHHDRSDELTGAALEHAPSELEKAEILVEVVTLYTTAGRYKEALETMHRGLKLISHELPSGDLEAAVGPAFGVVQEKLGGATPASLLDRPTMSDPEIRAATRLLLAGMAAAFYLDPFLYIVIICRAMALALEHGHPPQGVSVYAWYGHILSAIFGQPQAGYEFARLAVELSAKRRSPLDSCRSYFVLSWIYCWERSSHEMPTVLDAGFQAGLESGDLTYAGYILYYMDSNRFFCGAPLDEIAETLRENTTFNEKLKNINGIDVQLGLSHAIANLRGETPEPTDFRTEDRDEAALLARFETDQSAMSVCYYHVFKTMILGLYREFDEALEASTVAAGLLQAIVGNVAVTRHGFHTGLALAGKMERASEAEKGELREKLEGCRDQIAAGAEACPENFAHMHALLVAELARLDGNADEAIKAYERAIHLAAANDYPQDRALANELAGRFRLERDEDDLAAAHLSKARHGYLLWGARHKLRLLDDEFPKLAADRHSASRTSEATETIRTSTTSSSVQLDLASVLRASQAISGEIVLTRLLQRLMALVIENAGADRGVLLIYSDDELLVEANGSLESRDGSQHLAIEVQQGLPLDSYDGVPGGVVRYAVRTEGDVILGDASNEGSFTQDPYVVRQRPSSVACLPISNHGQLIGVLYLENKLTTDAFTEDRVDLLRVLSAQFAISLENARLYANLEESLDRQTRITRSFERFVPKQFLEQLGHDSILDVALGDQVQRVMTVLFMDVRGFSSLSENLSAKETFELLNSLLARLSPIIRRNGGFIDKYIGDAIMALFPGPSDGALTAALEIQRSVAAFREEGASDAQRGLHVGVGVHRGVTMLGTIGETERMDGTVISDAVNIASRLEGLTKSRGVGIVISEQALGGAEGAAAFVTRSLGQSTVKGRTELIGILELMG